MNQRTGRALRARALILEQLEDRSLPATIGLPSFNDLHINPSQYDAHHIIVAVGAGDSLPAAATSVVDSTGSISLGDNLYRVTLQPTETVGAAISYFDSLNGVRYAQPDFDVSVVGKPNDPSFSAQWGLNNTGQTGGTSHIDIGAPAAWNVTTGTGRTIVAVIDTGIDLTHPDLAANIWTNPHVNPATGVDSFNGLAGDIHGWNFVANNSNVTDENGHGTHVAGIIGAVGNNGVGVAGVDWHVQIMPLKFLDANGTGALSNAILAINYAVKNGATVINNSYSGGNYYYQAFSDAVANAQRHGVIFVAAAGNDGRNTDGNPIYPADYNLDNVLSVAAIDAKGNLAPFSNYGAASVDLGAPGAGIYSTYRSDSYITMSGTSMAAPFVTGAVALLHDLHPDWNFHQLINRILSTTDADLALQGKTVTGGRLDLARAIGAPPSITPPPSPAPAPTTPPITATTTFNSPDPIKAIPDLGRTTSTLTVNKDVTIGRVSVKLSVVHSDDSNLKITLTSPWGATLVLMNRRGGVGHNISTVLDDRATMSLANGAAPFLGWFKPDQALSALAGHNARGTWTLTVVDLAAGHIGKLTGWSITIVPAAGSASAAEAVATPATIFWASEPIFPNKFAETSNASSPKLEGSTSASVATADRMTMTPSASLTSASPTEVRHTLIDWLDLLGDSEVGSAQFESLD